MTDPPNESRIDGHVTDASGQPVAECVALLTGSSPQHRDIAALTDLDGRFRFDDLPPGHYEVMVRSGARPAVVRQVDVPAGKAAAVEVQLDG